jgi:hypothetical protein
MIQRPEWLRPPRGVRWTTMTALGAASAVVLGALGLWAIAALLSAIFTFGSSSDPASSLNDALKRHETLADASARRFNGRSAFFMPPAPVRKPPKPAKPPEPPPPPPPPPPPAAPREYAGPKPVGAIGDLVFFADQSQIRVGDERGGVKVLASSAPWSVRLAHGGGEYDVELWTRGKEPFFNNSDWRNTRSSTPGIDPVGAKAELKGNAGSTPSTPLVTTPGPNGEPGPGMRGPGMPPPATLPGVVPQDANQPAPPSGPGLMPAPGAKAPNAARNPWTTEHMAPPPSLSADQIASMPIAEAQASFQAISRARTNRNLDEATRQRLNQESEQLSNRIKELGKGQSTPP